MKFNSKKAQIGIEFVAVLGSIMTFMTIFFIIVNGNTEEKLYKRELILVKEIALTVQNEVNLATNSINGYSREFEIPSRAGNLDYEINASNGAVYIRTINGKHALSLPVPPIVGEVNITQNKIEKINGTVYLNR